METPVIDFHCHVGSWGRFWMDDDIKLFLRALDRAGIDRACINCIFQGEARRGNDLVAEFVRKAPDRFIPVAFVTPHYPDEMVPELERCFDQLGARYIKIYPHYVRVSQEDPMYYPIFEFASDRNLAVMSHAWHYFDPESVSIVKRYETLSTRFPGVHWVIAHGGSGWHGPTFGRRVVEAAHELPEIYLETCGRTRSGDIDYVVDRVGADRVLFGSDLPLLNGAQQIAKIVIADISAEEKQKILGLNAKRLLKL